MIANSHDNEMEAHTPEDQESALGPLRNFSADGEEKGQLRPGQGLYQLEEEASDQDKDNNYNDGMMFTAPSRSKTELSKGKQNFARTSSIVSKGETKLSASSGFQSDHYVLVSNPAPSKLSIMKELKESVINQTKESWQGDGVKHDAKDNFGRRHPLFKINGFIYTTKETLKQITKMRKSIDQYEKITDNHFFVRSKVSFIQDQTPARLQ